MSSMSSRTSPRAKPSETVVVMCVLPSIGRLCENTDCMATHGSYIGPLRRVGTNHSPASVRGDDPPPPQADGNEALEVQDRVASAPTTHCLLLEGICRATRLLTARSDGSTLSPWGMTGSRATERAPRTMHTARFLAASTRVSISYLRSRVSVIQRSPSCQVAGRRSNLRLKTPSYESIRSPQCRDVAFSARDR